jgi:hypothetical protein
MRLIGLILALSLAPLATEAQSTKVARVGIFVDRQPPLSRHIPPS